MSSVRTDTDGHVRVITIDRPEVRNAVDRPTADALAVAEGPDLALGDETLELLLLQVELIEGFLEVVELFSQGMLLLSGGGRGVGRVGRSCEAKWPRPAPQ